MPLTPNLGLLKNPSVSWTDSFGGKLCKHSLDNKYYTAELEFLTFGPESLHTSPTHLEEFGPTVDALLLSFDSHDVRRPALFPTWYCRLPAAA